MRSKAKIQGKYSDEAVRTARLAKVRGSVQKPKSEVKSFSSAGQFNMSTTGQVTSLNLMTQGTTAITRLGNEVRMKGVDLAFEMITNAAQIAQQSVSCALVWDNAPNGAIAGFGDIFTQTGGTLLRTEANEDRFTVLRTWRANQPIGGVSATESKFQGQEWKVRLNEITIYNGNAGTIADCRKGALVFVSSGEIAAGAAAGLGFINATVYFDDI